MSRATTSNLLPSIGAAPPDNRTSGLVSRDCNAPNEPSRQEAARPGPHVREDEERQTEQASAEEASPLSLYRCYDARAVALRVRA